MAIANLHETLLAYTLRKTDLNMEIMELQSQKQLAVFERGDYHSILSAGKVDIRNRWKAIYDANEEQYKADGYKDYTELVGFEDEINAIEAQIQIELERISAWETELDQQITTDSAELEEINAYMESIKSMLQSNIQEDFNYGLNG